MNVVAGEINWHVCWDFGFLAISEYGHNNRVEELQHSTLDLASTTRRQASFLFSPNPLLHLLLIIVHCFRTFGPKKKKKICGTLHPSVPIKLVTVDLRFCFLAFTRTDENQLC